MHGAAGFFCLFAKKRGCLGGLLVLCKKWEMPLGSLGCLQKIWGRSQGEDEIWGRNDAARGSKAKQRMQARGCLSAAARPSGNEGLMRFRGVEREERRTSKSQARREEQGRGGIGFLACSLFVRAGFARRGGTRMQSGQRAAGRTGPRPSFRPSVRPSAASASARESPPCGRARGFTGSH